MLAAFRWFARRFIRKRFHCLAVNASALQGMTLSEDDRLVVYANHASWWDPLTAMLLANRFFPQFRLYAPIDAEALAKYRMFAKLGFFGVDQHRREGPLEFLRTSRRILATPQSSIWITPEGRFADIRDATAPFSPGLGHLAASLARQADRVDQPGRVWFVPGAVEYAFWEEPKPEILCWFGKPVLLSADSEPTIGLNRRDTKLAWNELLFERLRTAQAELATASIRRDSSQFELLLGGTGGTFFIYDWWRKSMARLQGRSMRVEHSDKLSAEDNHTSRSK